MDTFPVLTKKPAADGFEESIAVDPTIKSEFADGTVETRPMFTGICESWKVTYKNLPTADRDIVKSFIKEQKVGSSMFHWINPLDGYRYTVRFSKAPVIKLTSSGPLKWSLSMEIYEAEPNSKTEIEATEPVVTGSDDIVAIVTGGILDT